MVGWVGGWAVQGLKLSVVVARAGAVTVAGVVVVVVAAGVVVVSLLLVGDWRWYPDRLTPVGKVQFDKVHFVTLLCDKLHFGKSPFATLHNAPDRCRWPGWGNCSRG